MSGRNNAVLAYPTLLSFRSADAACGAGRPFRAVNSQLRAVGGEEDDKEQAARSARKQVQLADTYVIHDHF